MANVIPFPVHQNNTQGQPPRYAQRLKTSGQYWVRLEKKLLDQTEFLEAMILVLDDVKLINIRNRDYGMMEIISEEISLYHQRLEKIKEQLAELRQQYREANQNVSTAAN